VKRSNGTPLMWPVYTGSCFSLGSLGKRWRPPPEFTPLNQGTTRSEMYRVSSRSLESQRSTSLGALIFGLGQSRLLPQPRVPFCRCATLRFRRLGLPAKSSWCGMGLSSPPPPCSVRCAIRFLAGGRRLNRLRNFLRYGRSESAGGGSNSRPPTNSPARQFRFDLDRPL